MTIPSWPIFTLFIVSFLILLIQYYRINPDWRLFNLHFGLMAVIIILMFVQIFAPPSSIRSMVLLAVAVLMLGLTIVLQRQIPPPRH